MRGLRKVCISFATHALCRNMLKTLAKNFNARKQVHRKELRRIWSAVVIKVNLKSKMRKLGPSYDERIRRIIKNSFSQFPHS